MPDPDFLKQLDGYGLTTAEIQYRMPDQLSLLQLFIWQQYDLAPEFPTLKRLPRVLASRDRGAAPFRPRRAREADPARRVPRGQRHRHDPLACGLPPVGIGSARRGTLKPAHERGDRRHRRPHRAAAHCGIALRFVTFTSRTSAKLFGVTLRILKDRAEAEEALQEVYVKIWQRADRYVAGRL